MGITIYYKGRINNTDLITPFIDELEDIAKDMNWQLNILDNDLSEPRTAYIEDGEIKGNLDLRGISITIHPDSESLSFYFDKNGNLRDVLSTALLVGEKLEDSYSFVKTQFAPIQIHITIIKLLRYIKSKYIDNLDVIDEGEYWSTSDEVLLKDKLGFIESKIKEISEMVKDLEFSSEDSLENMLDKIEKLFKRKLR